ncbi:Hypothetical protein D9617_2g055240 [Elsinoe fawcettii]|nr:Hypothetical protein D9617_2g055240 [Elsinoe fawcettii]
MDNKSYHAEVVFQAAAGPQYPPDGLDETQTRAQQAQHATAESHISRTKAKAEKSTANQVDIEYPIRATIRKTLTTNPSSLQAPSNTPGEKQPPTTGSSPYPSWIHSVKHPLNDFSDEDTEYAGSQRKPHTFRHRVRVRREFIPEDRVSAWAEAASRSPSEASMPNREPVNANAASRRHGNGLEKAESMKVTAAATTNHKVQGRRRSARLANQRDFKEQVESNKRRKTG